jgi:hypothetical protein
VNASPLLEREYRLYRKRIARCRTENQVNRVHIVLGNYMTPVEVRYFGAALGRDNADAPSQEWLAGFRGMMPLKQLRPAEFERRGILKGVSHYAAPAVPSREKTLIIGFAGNFHRMSVPAPVLLDCLDPALYDLVILRDFGKICFVRGIPGLGSTFFDALARLRQLIDPGDYRSSIALGTSAGGVPALLAAILLKLDRGICIGGMDYPAFAALLKSTGVDEPPYAQLLASRPDPFPDLLIAYAGAYAIDAAAAKGLQGRVPSRILEVKDCTEHGVLGWKLAQGRLPNFLSKLLGQNREQRESIAASEAE